MRLEQVFEIAFPLLDQQILSAYAEIQTHYDENHLQIDRQFEDIFQQLFELGVKAQQAGKGTISYFSISHLYSSIATGTGELLLALYDEQLYFDNEPVYIYWTPSLLWNQFDSDMKKIIHDLKNRLFRLKKYELDAVTMEYAESYFKIEHKMFANYSPLIISVLEKSELEKTPDFTILYGGYLDTAAVLWQEDKT